MISRSGFGWNDTSQMITVDDDDVWEKYVHTDAACTMRFKTFPFYSAWCEIFGKDGATGEHAEDLNGACNNYMPVFEDDTNGNGSDNEFMSVCQEQASASGKQAHQRKEKYKSLIM